MLSCQNCSPQLYIGNCAFRIFGKPREFCKNVHVDGVLYKRDVRIGSSFRRFLLNLEEEFFKSKPEDLIKSYGLEKCPMNYHDVLLGMLFFNQLLSPNIAHIYGSIQKHYYRDRVEHLEPLGDFLQTCTDQQAVHLLIQLLNLIKTIGNVCRIKTIDFLSAVRVQKLDIECPIALDNGRTLFTDVIVKLCDFATIGLAHQGEGYPNITGEKKSCEVAIDEVLQLIKKNFPDLEIQADLNFLSICHYSLPQTEKSSDTPIGKETNFFCNQESSSSYLELRNLVFLRHLNFLDFHKNVRIINLVNGEAHAIETKLNMFPDAVKEHRLSVDDLEEPDIGVGTGVYEKKIISLIQLWSVLLEIKNWVDTVDALCYTLSVQTLPQIRKKLKRALKLFDQVRQVISYHRQQILGDKKYLSYLDAYGMFDYLNMD